jgi:hypothetical protein|uniref:Uncharacterized protein n=1 Tax=Myoviridae sp. ct25F5 TaxID=2826604 RepID=A0A8S5LTD2_9CAUD|nr:MAG TPA: hypothetical protein [Myoviridae sp. ct25F5]
MTTKPLSIVSNAMKALGIEYGFGSYGKKPIVYPYFVGEYTESAPLNEDGLQTATIMLTGFHRGKWLDLETAKAKIEDYFDKVSGKTVMADDGSAVAIFYENTLIVPKEDAELKSIQINLSVQEWSVK